MIIAHGKHGDDLYDTGIELLRERFDEGWYYDHEPEVQKILMDLDEAKARKFLLGRIDHEYEYIEIRDDYVKKT